MRTLIAFLLLSQLASAQGRGAAAQAGRGGAAAAPTAAPGAADRAAFIRENYTKFEYRIAMRDGVKLFTSVYAWVGALISHWWTFTGEQPRPPRAKSVLFLFLFGGPSHLDTFDPKPEAPDECRGEFRPIDTSVSGVQICEHLPGMAQRMHHWALVRSMTCNPSFGDHRFAVQGMLGGVDELPAGAGLAASRHDWPSWCAGVEYFRRSGHGLAGERCSPGEMIDPGTGLYPRSKRRAAGSQIRSLSSPQQSGRSELSRRRQPANAGRIVDQAFGIQAELVDGARSTAIAIGGVVQNAELRSRPSGSVPPVDQWEVWRERWRSKTSPPKFAIVTAGMHFGQSMLMARRLIEAGIPIVQANITNHAFWDTHYNNFVSLRKQLLPQFDRALKQKLQNNRCLRRRYGIARHGAPCRRARPGLRRSARHHRSGRAGYSFRRASRHEAGRERQCLGGIA